MSADLNPKGTVNYCVATNLQVRCGVCAYFDADARRCVIVAGEIIEDCVCDLFGRRRPMRFVGGPQGVPASVSTIPVLDVPTLGRMDLMPGYGDVRRSFVRRSADGGLAFDAPEDTDQAWLDLIVAKAQTSLGLPSTTPTHISAEGQPVLDLLVSGDTARLVPHAPYLAQFDVVKQDDSQRYTMGPLYMPDTLDAHGEFVAPDTLQNAAWDYVRSAVANGSNTIFDQHSAQPAGEWVEIMTWPYEHVADVLVPGEGVVQRTFPPGTVYQGVVWNDRVWKQVVNGEKRGLSMGGSAIREPVPVVDTT